MPGERLRWAWVALLAPGLLIGCAPGRGPAAGRDADGKWAALAPGLRIDRAGRLLEFDAQVAVDAHNAATPDVFLELVACLPDTREHESLVVTRVPPSLIHAGLLALGYAPGAPARVRVMSDGSVERNAATGDRIAVSILVQGEGGVWHAAPAWAWIIDAGRRGDRPDAGWVFAGSRLADRGTGPAYDADGAGTVIGLASFGSETVAYALPVSPESSIDEPAWIADGAAIPVSGTPVRVRLGPP